MNPHYVLKAGIFATQPVFAAAAAETGLTLTPVYVLGVIGGSGVVIAFLFKLLISAKDREFTLLMKEKDAAIAELVSLKKSYQEIADESLKSAKATIDYYRAREGQPPVILTAPVISESHSPSTALQRETAAIATMRATMAEIKVVAKQEPRKEPPRAEEGR